MKVLLYLLFLLGLARQAYFYSYTATTELCAVLVISILALCIIRSG